VTQLLATVRHPRSDLCVDRARAQGGLDVAVDAAGCERNVHKTTELLRDEIANDADAVSAVGRRCNGGTADLAPCDRQVRRIPAESAIPVHLHPSVRCRQGAVELVRISQAVSDGRAKGYEECIGAKKHLVLGWLSQG